jgi:hypothetical protein
LHFAGTLSRMAIWECLLADGHRDEAVKAGGTTRVLFWMAVLLFVFSYLFNFVWESFHSVYLYEDHKFTSARYVPMVNSASAKDAVIILAMYLGIVSVSRGRIWLKHSIRKRDAVFAVVGVIVAAVIEYRAVHIKSTWAYNSHMPTLAGIGLSPLVQLTVTGLLAIWLARRLVGVQL